MSKILTLEQTVELQYSTFPKMGTSQNTKLKPNWVFQNDERRTKEPLCYIQSSSLARKEIFKKENNTNILQKNISKKEYLNIFSIYIITYQSLYKQSF